MVLPAPCFSLLMCSSITSWSVSFLEEMSTLFLPHSMGFSWWLLTIFISEHKHLSSQEKKQQQNDLEKVLVWRREEIISLKRERNWVGTLLDMCRKVQAFIKGMFFWGPLWSEIFEGFQQRWFCPVITGLDKKWGMRRATIRERRLKKVSEETCNRKSRRRSVLCTSCY